MNVSSLDQGANAGCPSDHTAPNTIDSSSHSPNDNTRFNRHCATRPRDTASCLALNVGWNVGGTSAATRWAKGSVLTFHGDPLTFPSYQAYSLALRSLAQAASEWNAVLNPYVTFRRVQDHEHAVFQLVYRQDTSKTYYAMSFFPDPNHTSVAAPRQLLVFAKAFQPENVAFLTNVFRHELGHVLGLRLECAPETEAQVMLSAQLGPRNPMSVMECRKPLSMLRIDPLDAVWARNFYAYDKRVYKGLCVVDVGVGLVTSS